MGNRGPWRTSDALETQLGLGPLDGVAARRRHHRAEAEPEAEEVFEGDRPVGGDRVVELGVDRPQHTPVRQFGQKVVDRILEPEEALLDQRHRRDGGDRLCERGDPEDGVARERGVCGEGRRADGVDVHVLAPGQERDQSRQESVGDMGRHRVVQAVQAGFGELGRWCHAV